LPPKPDFVREQEEGEARRRVPRPPWGVNVAGFFTSELGLGEAARLLVGALDAARVPALPMQGTLLPPSRQGAEFSSVLPADSPYPVSILRMHGDTVQVSACDDGADSLHDRYT